MKRWVSILLAVAMVFSMASVSAFAVEEDDGAQSDSADAVAALEVQAQEEDEPAQESVPEADAPAEEPKEERSAGSGDASLELMAEHEIYEKDHKTEIEVNVGQTLEIWFYTKGGCDGISHAMSFKSSDKNIFVIAKKPTIAGSDKGASWVRIKGVKEGTAVLTASVRGALSDNGKVFCTTDVKIIVKDSGSADPDPEPDPEPDPPAKTPVITSSETSIQLKTGEERTVLISTNLASNEYNHINAANAKNGPVSTTWGKWANDTSVYLTIKGLKAGADVVTVTLEGTNTVGEKVLATVKINVAVTENSDAPTTQIWASESSIKLAVNEKRTIVITENGNSYKFNKSCSDTSVVGAEWGEWLDSEQHSASLTLTGLKAGSAVMTVTARDENGNDLASTKINVTVTGSDPSTTGTKSNTITASSVTKNQSSKAQSFNLKASAKGGAKLSYKSNSSSVTVNSSGKVTIKKNFCGKAKITITAAAKGEYKKTTKKVTVTVKPGKPASLNLKTLKTTKVAFTWSKVPNATGYELWTVHKFGTQKFEVASTSFKSAAHGFKKNDSVTVKVRAYKTVDGKRIYSPWTTKKGKLK